MPIKEGERRGLLKNNEKGCYREKKKNHVRMSTFLCSVEGRTSRRVLLDS